MFSIKQVTILALFGLISAHKDFMDTVPDDFGDEDALILKNRKIDLDSLDFKTIEDKHTLAHRFQGEHDFKTRGNVVLVRNANTNAIVGVKLEGQQASADLKQKFEEKASTQDVY